MAGDTLVINIVGRHFQDENGNPKDEFHIRPGTTTKVKFHSQGQTKVWLESSDFLIGGNAHEPIEVKGDKILDVKSDAPKGKPCFFNVGAQDPFGARTREITPCMIVDDD